MIKKIFLFGLMSMFSCSLFAEEAAAKATQSKGSFLQTLIMIAIAVVFFYFILWRPEQKRRKKAEVTRNMMKKGDHVTAMGIVGVVDTIKEHTVIVKMVDGAKIEFVKAAISEVRSQEEDTSKKS